MARGQWRVGSSRRVQPVLLADVTLTGAERRGNQYTYEARTDVDARNLLQIQTHEVYIRAGRCVQACVSVVGKSFNAAGDAAWWRPVHGSLSLHDN